MGTQKIKCAVVGYGKNFNFGRMHGSWISNCEKLELVAVCDIDPESRERAKRDFPGIVTYESVDKLVKSPGIDLVTIVTPHYTHADIAI